MQGRCSGLRSTVFWSQCHMLHPHPYPGCASRMPEAQPHGSGGRQELGRLGRRQFGERRRKSRTLGGTGWIRVGGKVMGRKQARTCSRSLCWSLGLLLPFLPLTLGLSSCLHPSLPPPLTASPQNPHFLGPLQTRSQCKALPC